MTKKLQDDLDLGALFAAEKRNDVGPSDALMASILGDAAQVQQERLPEKPRGHTSFFKGIMGEIGGWKSVATFASCACFGVYVGYASPDTILTSLGSDLVSTESFDFTDSFSVESEYELSLLEG